MINILLLIIINKNIYYYVFWTKISNIISSTELLKMTFLRLEFLLLKMNQVVKEKVHFMALFKCESIPRFEHKK